MILNETHFHLPKKIGLVWYMKWWIPCLAISCYLVPYSRLPNTTLHPLFHQYTDLPTTWTVEHLGFGIRTARQDASSLEMIWTVHLFHLGCQNCVQLLLHALLVTKFTRCHTCRCSIQHAAWCRACCEANWPTGTSFFSVLDNRMDSHCLRFHSSIDLVTEYRSQIDFSFLPAALQSHSIQNNTKLPKKNNTWPKWKQGVPKKILCLHVKVTNAILHILPGIRHLSLEKTCVAEKNASSKLCMVPFNDLALTLPLKVFNDT